MRSILYRYHRHHLGGWSHQGYSVGHWSRIRVLLAVHPEPPSRSIYPRFLSRRRIRSAAPHHSHPTPEHIICQLVSTQVLFLLQQNAGTCPGCRTVSSVPMTDSTTAVVPRQRYRPVHTYVPVVLRPTESRKKLWVGADSNRRPAPCEGAVITGLDHQPPQARY